ncbi:MAG: penicillin-binding transpeptidase domain-containing protein, partial [Acidobacteriota bacterium]
ARPLQQRVLSSRTARLMREALIEAVESGTGDSAALNGYSSAGKTGTAQTIVNGVYSKTLHIPSFVGFAPVDDPVLAAVVTIHEPRGEYYAAKVAAPAFRQIMQRALMHLEVARDLPVRPPKKQASALATSPELEGRGGILDESGPAGRAEQDSRGVRGDGAGQDGRHVVVLERSSDRQLPDFTGMSLRRVLDWSNRLGLHLQAEGSGMAVSQRPTPGSGVYSGMPLEVHFSRRAQGQEQDVKSSSAQPVAEPGRGEGRH